jgi:hypothetical protein
MRLGWNAAGVSCAPERRDRRRTVDVVRCHVDLDRSTAKVQRELNTLRGRQFQHLADLLFADLVSH